MTELPSANAFCSIVRQSKHAKPTLVIQGADDRFGTLAQVDAICGQLGAPCERLILPDCGHSPHREQPAATLAAMTAFVLAAL